ncbi:MAG TPA: PEP-CTERM sorting domain-containing protein [Phycisphaerales bacterium]|nr:PEP-CTERM sorting domain-containing protein [Phycisphaerales bacterium]
MKTAALTTAIAAALAAPALAQPHHMNEMMLDWHLASNRIHVHAHGEPMPWHVPPSVFAGVNGWAAADIGFTSAETAHPHLGTDVFPPSVDIRAILVSSSPGIHVFGAGGPLPVGGEIVLGSPVIHHMPVWNITSTTPGEIKTMTWRFRDASGFLADSAPFTISLTAVPAPSAALMLTAGLAGLATRRRR